VAVSFGPSQPGPSPAEDIATVLQRTRRISRQSSIRVIVQNETAILRGEVATVHERDLAENLARLEPGVWDVKNELVVRSPTNIAAAKVRPAAGR
jgi:osmotically-inducible protein OsmY